MRSRWALKISGSEYTRAGNVRATLMSASMVKSKTRRW